MVGLLTLFVYTAGYVVLRLSGALEYQPGVLVMPFRKDPKHPSGCYWIAGRVQLSEAASPFIMLVAQPYEPLVRFETWFRQRHEHPRYARQSTVHTPDPHAPSNSRLHWTRTAALRLSKLYTSQRRGSRRWTAKR